ncbi:SSU ribosomal protein S5p (S2e) [Mycoplasmopsis meleagridis]|uniref:Small ribosomal subunit protein uS5 n=1 Tax=Mycoplasmopsis meleagridis ATCC 25294 TaxID=1264554 RepID=A0A0F5H2J1_9BACT|nr:SSU ribosomal protein S5p (S2e) [Mycoplasmopsis meleagridis ATCC 25294]OAD18455.1 SSU ribosomal protein S5p (S2e) [Mycoplasmopsis meleagridis]VEU77367.1 30S ribosomal protein S5 [Mycoplasmopsis meleagridis]
MAENKDLQPKKSASATKEVVAKTDKRPRVKLSNENNSNIEKTDKKPRQNKSFQRNERNNRFEKPDNDFSEKVVNIARVTKVVKGGRRFSFSAFVVVGDKKGHVGFGHGKANEVPDAIKKAIKDAKNNLITVPIYKQITVPHIIESKFLASKVMLKPAPKGKGIVASGAVRAVVELAGYTDIYTKTYGSRSKANIVRATLKALSNLRMPEQIALVRDKKVEEL